MIKAILFDLDGTLLNREDSVEKFINAQYERLNEWVGHIPREKYISRFIELDFRGYVWKDTVYQQMVAEFNITGLTWGQLLQDYVYHFKEYCVPFPNLHKMLSSLANQSIVLGVISNGKEQFQLDNIKALGIEKYFKIILISEKERLKKPDPRIYRKALVHLAISPKECIFVGDHPINDVKASKEVGMLGVWKKDSHWEDVDADFIIQDLMEITLLVEDIANKERVKISTRLSSNDG